MTLEHINQELQTLKEKKNYRSLPPLIHEGRDVLLNGQRMLNLSSNDYLGLSNDISLRKEFLKTLTPETFLPTSSSSRLLTGNFSDYQKLEQQLATMFGTESALIFNMQGQSGKAQDSVERRADFVAHSRQKAVSVFAPPYSPFAIV